MPTLAQVRDFVDNRLANLWTNQIVPRQNVFFGNRGRYWQGLITTSTTALPNNTAASTGVIEVTPRLNTRPTDQSETWADAGFNLEATIPMAIKIDVYNGAQGPGYVGQVWVKFNDTIFTRAQNNGPETWRTFGWAIYTELSS